MLIPEPLATESQSDYLARGHSALANEYPDTDQRNAILFDTWRKHRGEGELEKKAFSKFGDDRFVLVRDVPVFAEHEISGRDGKPSKYDRAALQAVCDRCNHRIADTGDFAAITNGHTPTDEQRAAGAAMPDVIGFSGPFRLGMIGNKTPRWAIFADEHHFKDRYDNTRRLPRRSPEVWLEERMENRFIDPIAALGAETPRLDMGLRFARTADGRSVEKYAAACAPGGASVVMPAPVSVSSPKVKPEDKLEAERYREHSAAATPDESGAPQNPQENPLMLSPEDVKQIVDAVMETEPMQWVRQQMLSDTAPAAGDATDGAALASEPSPAPIAAPNPAPGVSSPPSDDKDKDAYALATEKAKYANLEAEYVALRTQFDAERGERRKAERYSKLQELRTTFAFEMDKEVARCVPMSDEQFVAHLGVITENYQRIPVGASIYVPPLDKPEPPKTEKYSRDVCEKAVKIADDLRKSGAKEIVWDDCLKRASESMPKAVAG
jgi:hypothetical protein